MITILSKVSPTDDTFLSILTHFIEKPVTVTIFIILVWITYLIYKGKFHILKELIPFKKFRKKTTSKSDLINHPIFKDLEFWADYKVPYLYNFEQYNNIDKAKLLIAKDLLIIKFKLVHKELSKILKDYLENESTLNIINIVHRGIDTIKSTQYEEFRKNNIPSLFIEKWFEVCRIRDTYLSRALNEIINSKLIWSEYDKIYVILSNVHVYYSAMLSDMAKTIQSINGDLKGEIYKNVVIGGNDYRKYMVPDKSYIPIVESRLNELTLLTNADNVAITVFHDINGDDYINGMTSKIYGYNHTYTTTLFDKIQYTTCTFLDTAIPNFKQHKASYGLIDSYNNIMQQQMKISNCEGIFMVPIFNDNALKGMLTIGYESEEQFEKTDKDDVIRIMMRYASLLNIYTDYRPTGLNYSNL